MFTYQQKGINTRYPHTSSEYFSTILFRSAILASATAFLCKTTVCCQQHSGRRQQPKGGRFKGGSQGAHRGAQS